MRVAVIGGGSSYTPELVEGFILRQSELPLTELRLVDVEAGRDKVAIIAAMTRRMLDRAGMQVPVTVHFDRRAALDGADFVISQFRVGGLDARALDERIPLEYGVLGQETTGPGGFFKALRTIAVVLDICREMRELCPDAWLINFTNPSGILAEAILQHGGGVKSMGLCNNPVNMHLGAAKLLGADPGQVWLKFFGLNHLVWATVYADGRDVTPRVLEAMSVDAATATPANLAALPYDREHLLGMGAMPCGYYRYYCMGPAMVQKEREAAAGAGTRAEVVKRTEAELFELYRDPELNIKPPQLAKRGGAHYSDAAVSLVSAIYNDKREIHAVNITNGSAMPDLPAGAAVEISAVVGRAGATPLTIGPLRPQLRGLIQQVKAYEELTVLAGVTGDPALALQALAANPLVPSVAVARQLWAAMAKAHAAYLSAFR